ncbi:hypothetical protein [Niallia circulans]
MADISAVLADIFQVWLIPPAVLAEIILVWLISLQFWLILSKFG